MLRSLTLTLVLLIGFALLSTPALAAEKISVLLIDGQNSHNWKATSPVLK